MGGRDRRTEKKRDKERERERDFNSKTLFYKDCSLGSVKTCLTTSTCYATNERERERQAGRQKETETQREREGGGRFVFVQLYRVHSFELSTAYLIV